jgi:hypothetical protein
MDLCKDSGDFAQVIEEQKRVLQRAKKRQGQCPCDRKSRDVMLFEFIMAAMATTAKKHRKEARLIHSSFFPQHIYLALRLSTN